MGAETFSLILGAKGVFFSMKTDKVFKGIGSTYLLVEKHPLTKKPQAHWPSQPTHQECTTKINNVLSDRRI